MITCDELVKNLDTLLKVKLFRDYAPNGLQVAGKTNIQRVLTAVTASQKAIQAAIDFQADALLVHHGYFWKGEPAPLIGIKRARIKSLLEHDINLIAYHLPLDQHPEYGNNVLFGRALGARNVYQSVRQDLIWHGEIERQTPSQLQKNISAFLGREAMMVGDIETEITRIAWCTGAAQDFFADAVMEGAQVYISGEYAERTYHEANELQAGYISCGHHASERFGVQALAQYLQDVYGIETTFFDEPNPF